jgi:rubrerythrin
MRASLLGHDPQLESVTLPMLVGIAMAIELEAVHRYELLEQTMRRRGELETADAFQRMLEEEREHVASVRQRAQQLHVPIPDADEFRWVLPGELETSWDAIAGSALLTPYRAFAIAVENEQRAFSFYAYLAAHAADRSVAVEAERLAAEELRHAARVRRWRREAYHRDRRRGEQPAPGAVAPALLASPEALRGYLEQRLAGVAHEYRALADRLRGLGDGQSADLLDAFIASHPTEAAGVVSASGQNIDGDVIPASHDPVHLLVAAQKPLEALVEKLESILSGAQDEAFACAERAITDAVGWIARLSLQIERRSVSGGQ